MEQEKEFKELIKELYRHQFKQVQERVKSGCATGEDMIFIRDHLKGLKDKEG
ncbi:hypothetical protein [Nitrosomonas nitrosa]|uniref:hypothetical protein n=1 Tax=Nitrosomonas nitrosa TaxID=52442 RepID=UPI0015E66BC2|nr:hypothetical protein [Nitrosomonas nitrosa]